MSLSYGKIKRMDLFHNAYFGDGIQQKIGYYIQVHMTHCTINMKMKHYFPGHFKN